MTCSIYRGYSEILAKSSKSVSIPNTVTSEKAVFVFHSLPVRMGDVQLFFQALSDYSVPHGECTWMNNTNVWLSPSSGTICPPRVIEHNAECGCAHDFSWNFYISQLTPFAFVNVASVVHANCKVERWKFRRMCSGGKAAAIGPQNSGCVHTGLLDKTKELHDGWLVHQESSLRRRQSHWGGESIDTQTENPINRGF